MTPNNDNNFISEIKQLTGISMTTDEKQSIRRELEDTLQETRSNTNTQQSPAWVQQLRQLPYLLGKSAVGFAAVLFLVGGLTYAAEDSLPGSPLYTVKKNINEAFISVTSLSDSRQAATQSKLAARRINELQALVNSGKLTTTTSQELLEDIAAHTQMARQNIADLESAGDKKHQQAAELRSQLTALLAAESKSLESLVSTSSNATSSDNSLAQEAAQKLIAIAKEDSDFNVATDGDTVTKTALTDLLRITVNRLDDNYQMYQDQNDTEQTPPPKELVTAAHDLEAALEQIQKHDYEIAVTRLQSLLEQLDAVSENLADDTGKTATSSNASSTTASSATSSAATTTQTAASTTESNSKATSSTQQPASSTDDTQAVAPSIPSKQNLHNETISDILKRVRSYLDEIGQKAGEKNKKQAATSTPMDDKTKKQASTTASSTASSTPEQSNSGTSSDNGQAGSPDPQQGDESRP